MQNWLQETELYRIFVNETTKRHDGIRQFQQETEYRHVENSNNINNQHIGQTNITVFMYICHQINK